MTLYTLFSNNAVAPGDKITVLDQELFSKLQLKNEAINSDNARYAHYYEEFINDYGITEYHYVTTKNA